MSNKPKLFAGNGNPPPPTKNKVPVDSYSKKPAKKK